MSDQIFEQRRKGSVAHTDPLFSSFAHISHLDPHGAESFRRQAELATAFVARHISDRSCRGLKMYEPAELLEQARSWMNLSHGTEDTEAMLESVLRLYADTGIPVSSPTSMGRQFSAVVPLAAIIDFVSSAFSQPSTFYEAAQLPNVAERLMKEVLAERIGWSAKNCGMVTISGGSLANLTAILAARNVKIPTSWQRGVGGGDALGRPAIAVSAACHYSVSRAAGILGIGADQIVELPTNRCEQIDNSAAETTLEQARREGLHVFCMVASAGTTNVGAIDDIAGLAAIAKKHDIWLHVDGAHGASLLLSEVHRSKLRGIEHVDSITWDAHKMLFMPAACSMLFYKNPSHANMAFHQDASYVFEADGRYTAFSSGERNLECTKRPMIMPLWICWSLYGQSLFSEAIDHALEMAAAAFAILQYPKSNFVPINEPEANILCFRYHPPGLPESQLSDLQLRIWDTIRSDGKFFISKVKIQGSYALRVVFMNRDIRPCHFESLLQEIQRIGNQLSAGQ
jgi:L-2,4-diaminobutyrate decarboxylase